MKKNKVYSWLYLLLWILPLYIFMRDFFNIDEIKNIDILEIKELFKISLIQGSLSVIFATIVAIIPAYYMSYKKNIISKMLESLIFIPFFFPTVSTVIAFTLIFKLPILNRLNVLYTLKIIIIANVFYNSPIMIKYLSQGMRSIPKNIIEAGKIDGLQEIGVFFRIKLPLIFPQVFRGMFLVFIYTFSSFGIVLALGGIRYSNLEVEIANTLMKDGDFTKALCLGLFQFLILISINILGERLPSYELNGEEETKEVGVKTTTFTIVYLLFEYLVLVIGVLYGFFNYYKGEITFEPLFTLFQKGFNENYPVIEAMRNSLILSTLTPFIVIIFAYLLLKNYSKLTGGIVFSTLGFSSAFLGIGLIYINIVYDIKLWILLICGYTLITVPIAYSFMYQYIVEFPKDILELAKIDRLSKFKSFILIELPILKNVFIGTYLQIFAIILGEFTISYSMQLGSTFPTLALVNYSLFSNKKLLEGSALSSLNIIIVLILFYLSNKITKNKK